MAKYLPLVFISLIGMSVLSSCSLSQKQSSTSEIVKPSSVTQSGTIVNLSGALMSPAIQTGNFIIKDNSVYWIDRLTKTGEEKKIAEADVSTFSILTPANDNGHPEYAKDKNNVYLLKGNSLVNLKNADPQTFEVLRGSFSKDKNSVYWIGSKLEGVDAKTFAPIDDTYGKDKDRVYHLDFMIDGADPATFEIIDSAKSQDRAYTYEIISEGLDQWKIVKTKRTDKKDLQQNSGDTQSSSSGSYINELALCTMNGFGKDDFTFSNNLGNRLFAYKNYTSGPLLISEPIATDSHKYFTLTYYNYDYKGEGEGTEKIEIYDLDCKNSTSRVIHTSGGGRHKYVDISGVHSNKLYTHEIIGDSIYNAYGKYYVLDLNTKNYSRIFEHIEIDGYPAPSDLGEGSVLFNKDFTKAIKFQKLDDVYSTWKIAGVTTEKKIYFLVSDINTKKTIVLDDGILDYSYMGSRYMDFIRWVDNTTIEVTLSNGDKKNILIK